MNLSVYCLRLSLSSEDAVPSSLPPILSLLPRAYLWSTPGRRENPSYFMTAVWAKTYEEMYLYSIALSLKRTLPSTNTELLPL